MEEWILDVISEFREDYILHNTEAAALAKCLAEHAPSRERVQEQASRLAELEAELAAAQVAYSELMNVADIKRAELEAENKRLRTAARELVFERDDMLHITVTPQWQALVNLLESYEVEPPAEPQPDGCWERYADSTDPRDWVRTCTLKAGHSGEHTDLIDECAGERGK